MKKQFFLITILLLFSLVLCSCRSANNSGLEDSPSGDNNISNSEIVYSETRKIVYTVEYRINSTNIKEVISNINNKTNELQGYISNSKQTDDNSYYEYKIPTNALNSFLNVVDSFNVTSKTMNSRDITTTYNEIAARIIVLNANREAYVNMLSNPDITLENMILINDKISQIDVELKELELAKDNLNNSINYSTVSISYTEAQPKKSALKTYGNYILSLLKSLLSLICYTAPFALVAGGSFGIVMAIKKRKNKNK